MSSTENSPLNVTDEQMTTIYRASDVLLAPDRPAFLAALADRLRAEPIVGDGNIGRAIRELQRQYLRPPLKTEAHAPKHEFPSIFRGRADRQHLPSGRPNKPVLQTASNEDGASCEQDDQVDSKCAPGLICGNDLA